MPKIPWTKKTIQVAYKEDGKGQSHKKDMEALVLGPIAVHPDLHMEKWWAVASVTLGLKACRVEHKADALKIGEILWYRCQGAFREKTDKEIVAKLPLWIMRWCRKCNMEGAWVDPDIFKAEFEKQEIKK